MVAGTSWVINAIAVAVADSPVGIDIERVRPVNYLVVRRFYSAREQKYVYGSREETNARFSEVWTRKEACIKCNKRDTSVRAFHIDAFKGKIAKQIKTFSIKGYYISVCCNQPLPRCIHHIRNPWDTLGLGEDQGVEVFQKAWRCFLFAPTSRKLWLCPVQYTVSYRNSRGESNTETGRSGMGGIAPSFQTVKIKE